MKLELKIAPDVEQALEAKAQRLGVPVERYAAGVLRRDVESNGGPYESAQSARLAARRALEALAAGTRTGLPPIPDAALSSESLYTGRGEILGQMDAA